MASGTWWVTTHQSSLSGTHCCFLCLSTHRREILQHIWR